MDLKQHIQETIGNFCNTFDLITKNSRWCNFLYKKIIGNFCLEEISGNYWKLLRHIWFNQKKFPMMQFPCTVNYWKLLLERNILRKIAKCSSSLQRWRRENKRFVFGITAVSSSTICDIGYCKNDHLSVSSKRQEKSKQFFYIKLTIHKKFPAEIATNSKQCYIIHKRNDRHNFKFFYVFPTHICVKIKGIRVFHQMTLIELY